MQYQITGDPALFYRAAIKRTVLRSDGVSNLAQISKSDDRAGIYIDIWMSAVEYICSDPVRCRCGGRRRRRTIITTTTIDHAKAGNNR